MSGWSHDEIADALGQVDGADEYEPEPEDACTECGFPGAGDGLLCPDCADELREEDSRAE